MEKTLVSIIMPAYNAEKYIREAIESILKQTYTEWELIIVDDASVDTTLEIIKEFQIRDNRIICVKSDKNEGVASARNKGIQAAKGEYIAFLDSDDLWKAEKLEIQIHYMQEHNCGFVYSAYDVIDEKNVYQKTITPYWDKVSYKKLLNTNIIACCTAVIKSEYIKDNLMPQLKHEDYATWLNILKNHQLIAECVPGILASYRLVKGSVSSNKIKTIGWNWKIYRYNQQLGFLRSVRQIISFICMTGFKYLKH